jgi:hypothetical protein
MARFVAAEEESIDDGVITMNCSFCIPISCCNYR